MLPHGRHLRLSALGALLVGLATVTYAQSNKPLAPAHPIVGTWKLIVPGSNCAEIYTFRSDGTRLFSSAEETGESEFVISDTRSERGFYRLVDTVKHINGKPDCSGSITADGDRVTVFILLHPESSDEFAACQDESLAQCLGPFKRVSKGAS
jgi:hypothetical protein